MPKAFLTEGELEGFWHLADLDGDPPSLEAISDQDEVTVTFENQPVATIWLRVEEPRIVIEFDEDHPEVEEVISVLTDQVGAELADD